MSRLVQVNLFAMVIISSFCKLDAISVSEKKNLLAQHFSKNDESIKDNLKMVNREMQDKKKELLNLYLTRDELTKKRSQPTKDEDYTKIYEERSTKIDQIKKDLKGLEEKFKELSRETQEEESEALWHQPDATIGQLVIDYGSSEYAYLMPPEIASLKIHISSQVSIPKVAWTEMLELLLSAYGIGVKQLSPHLRQLYFLRLNPSGLHTITDSRVELGLIPQDARTCFVITPEPTEVRRIFQFMEKFAPQEQMTVQVVGANIVLIGYVREINEILRIYDFISQPKQMNEWKIVSLQKGQSEEIAKIIHLIFDGDSRSMNEHHNIPFMPSEVSLNFRCIPLKHPAQSLFLLGRGEQIERASKIIQDIENQIGEVQEKVLYWYPCKNSEAEDLAKVLSRVYSKMISQPSAFDFNKDKKEIKKPGDKTLLKNDDPQQPLPISQHMLTPGVDVAKKRSEGEINENFIVDSKTNSLVIVVEAYLLPKLKELLKKLDVPKRMVQIDVLLLEKKVIDNNNFGLNLLKLGAIANHHKHPAGVVWNHMKKDGRRGILNFIVSGHAKHLPAYDLAFNFLLSQENVSINANPTITTVNQTPAKITLVDEISINTGVVEIDTTKTTRMKDSYTRAQYGILMTITPVVHAKVDNAEDEDEPKYITLTTDITFDTTHPNKDNRPDVTRRNIKNEVRIANGETVILGGLRRKIASEDREFIPFFGEIPGIGKLFSTTSLNDASTEMFIFLTPRIVPDPKEEYEKMREKELKRRPGDIPEFMKEIEESKKDDQLRLFHKGIKMLFSGNQ